MTTDSLWTFRDDRGHGATASRPPRRIVAYVQAAAALHDLGLPVHGIFGSAHDKDGLDPAKAGTLRDTGAEYLGSGAELSAATVLGAEPDLLVSVTYDGKQLYGLDPSVAEEVEAEVPTVALGVGPGHRLSAVRGRFAELARSLGMESGENDSPSVAPAEAELARSTDRLREAAQQATGVRVMALSPAGADKAHVARPRAWPDLQELADAGVRLVDIPGPGPNWTTVGWEEVAAAGPDLVLADMRGNATPLTELTGVPDWQRVTATADVLPWNPELPCTAPAIGEFFDAVSHALARKAGGPAR